MKAMLCFKLSCLTLLFLNILILVITFCRAKDLAYLFITHTHTHAHTHMDGLIAKEIQLLDKYRQTFKCYRGIDACRRFSPCSPGIPENGSCDSWLWNKMLYLPYCSPHLGHKGEWGRNSSSPNWANCGSSGHSHYRDWLHAMDLLLAQEQKTDVNSWEDWWALREHIFTTHVHVIFRE